MRKCVPFMLFFLIEVVGNIDAQIIRKGEWEKFDLSQYTDKRLYVKKYEDAALNIKGFYKSGADGLTVGRSVKIDSIPKTKDEFGSEAYNEFGIVQRAIRLTKELYPDLIVIADICLCEYTSHGHCGVI